MTEELTELRPPDVPYWFYSTALKFRGRELKPALWGNGMDA